MRVSANSIGRDRYFKAGDAWQLELEMIRGVVSDPPLFEEDLNRPFPILSEAER